VSSTINISSQGLIYFQCPVLNRETDPTSDAVAVAFLARGSMPVGTESWTTGSWDTSATGPTYKAQVLVGVSPGVVLDPGDYDAFVKITDSPEVPILGPYQLTVY